MKVDLDSSVLLDNKKGLIVKSVNIDGLFLDFEKIEVNVEGTGPLSVFAGAINNLVEKVRDVLKAVLAEILDKKVRFDLEAAITAHLPYEVPLPGQ